MNVIRTSSSRSSISGRRRSGSDSDHERFAGLVPDASISPRSQEHHVQHPDHGLPSPHREQATSPQGRVSMHHAQTLPTPLHENLEHSTQLRHITTTAPGAEPGIDFTRTSSEYDHISMQCQIEVIEYGINNVTFREYDNQGFLEYLEAPDSTKSSISQVRWLNIRGIDWTIIRALSLAYDIHPLAVEDIFQATVDSRSKADYYPKHIFLQCLALLHAPRGEDTDDHSGAPSELGARQGLHVRHRGNHATANNDIEVGQSPYTSTEKPGTGSPSSSRRHLLTTPSRRRAATTEAAIRRLREKEKINVKERNIYIFLTRDGTLISIHESMDSVNDVALKQRLHRPQTLLRSTAGKAMRTCGSL
ncbi:hypothetical protein FRC02_003897 [Tulasnella sp. 418]|nr:hypothetical protein FRC02_003897 [Tulasnella sp. 418]